MADAFPISGNIDPKGFPFLLMDLHQHGATGSLKVDGPSYQKALYYRSGRILFGSSNDPRDQLGAILIEGGKITPEQLEDINTKVGPGNPLAKVLAESGFVSQRELGEAARAKVERILSDVIAYDGGSFEFEDGVLPKGAVDLKLSTEKLVLAAVRRVSDRNFVLRHLESLEVVLTPAPDIESRLAEVRADAGGLPDQIDGRRSLKEAASLTRLEEFEAAKVACALLFLGMLQRAQGAGAGPQFIGEEGDELDLARTARVAFGDSGKPTQTTPESEPAFFVPSEAEPSFVPPAAEAPTFVLPTPSPAESPPFVTPPIPPPPTPAAPPPPPGAPVVAPPTLNMPPLKPPPWREPDIPAISMPPLPSRPSRPSKEDLAALDALLNSRSIEGPLEPLERTPAREQDWEPKFGGTQPGRQGRRERSGNPLLFGGIALLVAGLAGGGWYYVQYMQGPKAGPRVGGGPSPSLSTVPPTTEPAASPVAGPTATAAPSAPAPTTLASATPPTTLPRATAPPTTAPATTRGTRGATLEEARGFLQKGDLSQASRAFAASLKSSSAGFFSVQLLVACSDETVQKAVQNVAAPELFILPVSYKGRDCHRLCWGLYETEAKAASAVRSLPEYFRKGGATPKVAPTASLLP